MQNRSLKSYWRSPPGRLWRGTSCWAASQRHNLLGSLAAPQPAGQPRSATTYWAALERHNLPEFFPHFSDIFFKNFVLGPCGLFKVINIGSGNSVLDSILHFPLSLYHFPPYPHFPLPKGQISLSTLLQEIYL